MKFVLLVEGQTENNIVGDFFRRWFDYKYQQNEISQKIRIQTVLYRGWSSLVKDVANQTIRQLEEPSKDSEIIAVISLLDLYGPDFYPEEHQTVQERYRWGKNRIEQKVKESLKPAQHAKFAHFFAVHETEAWLLSDPAVFPQEIKQQLPKKKPELVNFNEPPSKLLKRLYRLKTGREYSKTLGGKSLFAKLDPNLAYDECPYLKEMLDEMLKLAKAAGL